MFELDSIVGIAIFALWAYCIFDVIRTPDGTTENLPKRDQTVIQRLSAQVADPVEISDVVLHMFASDLT